MAGDEKRSPIPTIIACIITALWAVSYSVDIIVVRYDPPAGITPIMLAASGFLFGTEFMTRRSKNGNGHDKQNKEEAKPHDG